MCAYVNDLQTLACELSATTTSKHIVDCNDRRAWSNSLHKELHVRMSSPNGWRMRKKMNIVLLFDLVRTISVPARNWA